LGVVWPPQSPRPEHSRSEDRLLWPKPRREWLRRIVAFATPNDPEVKRCRACKRRHEKAKHHGGHRDYRNSLGNQYRPAGAPRGIPERTRNCQQEEGRQQWTRLRERDTWKSHALVATRGLRAADNRPARKPDSEQCDCRMEAKSPPVSMPQCNVGSRYTSIEMTSRRKTGTQSGQPAPKAGPGA
jgi:hypothetical protein